jgi:hypothetical protein
LQQRGLLRWSHPDPVAQRGSAGEVLALRAVSVALPGAGQHREAVGMLVERVEREQTPGAVRSGGGSAVGELRLGELGEHLGVPVEQPSSPRGGLRGAGVVRERIAAPTRRGGAEEREPLAPRGS